MSDDNVTRIYPEFIVDHDDDGDGYSDSKELAPYVPRPSAVDLATARVLARREDRAEWADRCRGALELRVKAVAFHGVRAPGYAFMYSTHAGRGLGRVTSRIWHWTHDTEGLEMRVRAATDTTLTADQAIRAHAAAHDARVLRIRWRRWFTGILIVFLLLVARWAVLHHPWWSIGAGAAIAVILGVIGSQRGEVIQHLEMPAVYSLTVDLVERAFVKAKIPKITPDDPAIVVTPPYDAGRGYVVRVQLPEGATYASVLTATSSLASGLNCPLASLDLDDLPFESERLLEVFVAKEHPMLAPIPEWPLLALDRWDVWRPVPVGWDIRGREVTVALLWLHTLVGAAPQRGKTSIMRLLAIAALLDPRCDVIIADFKAGIDWIPYKKWCLRFIHNVDTDTAVAEFVELLVWLEAERGRRMAAITKMDLSDVPQGRITPAMAERAGFRPIVVFVDEMQEATQSENGKAIVTAWAKLEKKCPAAGITIIKATQKPDDKSAPTELRDVSLQRIALSVPSRHASEAVLGTEAYQQGLNAAALGGKPGLGIVWAMDSEDGPGFRGRLRIPNCTPQIASMMLERVARVRQPITVTAEARDLPDDDPKVPPIVRDALHYWPRPEMNCHQDVLAQLMNLDQVDLGRSMRDAGIQAEPVKMRRPGDDRTSGKRGYHLVDLEAVTR